MWGSSEKAESRWEIVVCCSENEDQLRLQASRNMQAAVMKIHQQLRRTDQLQFRIRGQLRAWINVHAAVIHRVRSLNLPRRQCFQTKCNKFAINFFIILSETFWKCTLGCLFYIFFDKNATIVQHGLNPIKGTPAGPLPWCPCGGRPSSPWH